MPDAENPFQVLYVSQLAPGCDFGVVKEIVAVSRQRNPERRLTGALLFDGERFCQLIEGAQAEVQQLMRRIARDPRHADVRMLFVGRSGRPRSLQRWASGYCDSAELEAFDAADGLRERPALEAFISVLRGADVE